jgi:hypothetical protein
VFEECGEPISLGIMSIRDLLGKEGMNDMIFGAKDVDIKAPEEEEYPSDIEL